MNTQDVVDCIHKYPKCQIVFDVDWEADTQFGVQVQARKEIRFLSYETMQELVKKAPIHQYQNRVDDVQGNAKGSYILDLQDMELVEGTDDIVQYIDWKDYTEEIKERRRNWTPLLTSVQTVRSNGMREPFKN